MKKLYRLMISVAIVAATLAVTAGAAVAYTTTYSGELTTDDETLLVVLIVTPNCQMTQGSVDVHYDVIEFLHPLPGPYSFTISSEILGSGIAAYLYEGSFDPENPTENCVTASNSGDPVELTWDFAANTPYYLVIFDDTFAQEGGDWQAVVESPDPVANTVGLVDPATGQWHLRNEAGLVASFFYGNPGDVPVMGDWDCDGIDTPGLFRTSDAFAYLRNSNSEGVADTRFFFGNPSDIPLAGDFDGDGCDTLSIYRPSEQTFYIVNELGADEGGLGPADFSFVFGNPGDKPFVGDFDGNGTDEVGLHRESTGFVYYRTSLTTGVADNQFFFGDPGDRFVAGDWGVVDRADTPAVFRPGNTTFYFRHTNTEGNADDQFVWGQPGWLPVAGAFGLDAPPAP